MFIMFHTAIMLEDLSRVDHFINDEVYSEYQMKIKELQIKNLRQMYDELNVASSEIVDVNVIDNKIIVKVLLVAKYIDYVLDKSSGSVISGNNLQRVEKKYYLTLEKRLDAKKLEIARECPACGANMNVNYSGKCEYCGSIFNTEDYDWIITKIEK